MPSSRSWRSVLVAAATAVVVVLMGSVAWTALRPAPDPLPTRTPAPLPDEGVAAELLAYYEQTVSWAPCESDRSDGGDESYDCGWVDVPMDYGEPTGERVSLAVKRLRAADADARVGSLLVNPGGPGVPGTSLVDAAPRLFGQPVLDAYDVVGFDPRGVGSSSPVECVDASELDELRAKVYDTDQPGGLEEFTQDMREFGQACLERTGSLLAFVDTISAARDLDLLRGVLGDARLNYLGYSYGTLLGATYADLYPGRVGRMVLDGAIDPTLDRSEARYRQAAGFEAALRSYVEDCLAGNECPLRGTADEAVGQVRRFLDLLAGSPLPTGTDRDLTQSLAVNAIVYGLYDDRLWPYLTGALDVAVNEGDGRGLLLLADVRAEREPDGDYATNLIVALRAVNCLDEPTHADPDAMEAEATRLRELSPTFGEFLAYGDVVCDEWPVAAAERPGPLDAPGAAPILVVGTTGDPATPYSGAEALAEQLESGYLLTYEGEGHTAYGRSNDCVEDAVDRYLVGGELPVERLVC